MVSFLLAAGALRGLHCGRPPPWSARAEKERLFHGHGNAGEILGAGESQGSGREIKWPKCPPNKWRADLWRWKFDVGLFLSAAVGYLWHD